ncbi:TDT family transporter [Shewanella algae]|uniref:TDT family transporter n=1 Tax=Shewanella algae TaxID=38313 RepID=UPI003984F869
MKLVATTTEELSTHESKFSKAAFRRLPSPLAGLALAIASLGWAWENVLAEFPGLALGAAVAGILLSLLTVKFILHPELLNEELRHPVVGSVLPTFAMALMVISKAVGIHLPLCGFLIWLTAIAIHCCLLAAFVLHRAMDFNLEHMVPSWFVPPIGMVVAAVTFPGAEAGEVGAQIAHIILMFGLVSYLVMLPVMLYRLIFCNPVADAAKPTIAILAAPASLSLAGYLTLTPEPELWLVALLLSLALLMTLVIYLAFLHLLRLPFSPGFAAYTFPMVIGATALLKTAAWCNSQPMLQSLHRPLALLGNIELVIASAIVGFVAISYLRHYRPWSLGN